MTRMLMAQGCDPSASPDSLDVSLSRLFVSDVVASGVSFNVVAVAVVAEEVGAAFKLAPVKNEILKLCEKINLKIKNSVKSALFGGIPRDTSTKLFSTLTT